MTVLELSTQSVAASLISLQDLGDSHVDESWMIPVEMLAYNGYNLIFAGIFC